MKMFAYTFKTWALAQVFHPFVLLIYISIRNSIEPAFWIGSLFFIFLFSVFASIPSLLIAWLLLYILSNADLFAGEKFIGWLFSVAGAIVLNFFFLQLATGGVLDGDINEIITPAIIAGLLSVFLRAKSFFLFQLNYTMIKNDKS